MRNKLRDLLAQAGFKGSALDTAYAVAMAESGGNARAHNGNAGTGDNSFGLFQINMLGGMGPARRRQYGLGSNEDLYDPLTNAKIAFQMSGGGKNWSPWSAYKNGSYKNYLQKGGPVTQQAGQAYRSSPAAVVNGPSPQQLMAFRQQSTQTLLSMTQGFLAGQMPELQAVRELQQAKLTLAQASQQLAQSEMGARQYGGTTMRTGPQVAGVSKQANTILEAAHAQIGKPYVWGAESPEEGFDCSGLIDWAFKQAGIDLPGRLTTQTALKMGVSVKGKPYQPGDWIVTGSGGHMVMYVGNGKVIAAPRKGEVVQYQDVSRFDGNILDVRRVLK